MSESAANQSELQLSQVMTRVAGAGILATTLVLGGCATFNQEPKDPCAAVFEAPSDNGLHRLMTPPGSKSIWVETYFEPSRVSVVIDGKFHRFNAAAMAKTGPEVSYKVGSTATLFVDVSPGKVTTHC